MEAADRIIAFLKEHDSIDDESVAYDRSGTYPFTLEEFRSYTEALFEQSGGWDGSDQYFDETAYFETYNIPFQHEGDNFYMRIMFGQGSAWQLYTEESFKENKVRWDQLHKEWAAEDESKKAGQ